MYVGLWTCRFTVSWLGASPGAIGIRKDVDVFVGLGFRSLDAIWANTMGNRNCAD